MGPFKKKILDLILNLSIEDLEYVQDVVQEYKESVQRKEQNSYSDSEHFDIVKKYTLFWLGHKQPQIIEGYSIDDALRKAGYGSGALRALDFWAHGESDEYEYNDTKKGWVLKDSETQKIWDSIRFNKPI